jgi:hypothetical protein
MAPDLPSPSLSPPSRRRWLVLGVAVLALIVALAVWAMHRGTTNSAEDCEDKPPPNAFAVAGCDDGSAPAGGKTPKSAEPGRAQP